MQFTSFATILAAFTAGAVAQSSCKYSNDGINHYEVVVDTTQDGGLCGGFFANLNGKGTCPVCVPGYLASL
jgi:hypothetical protein